MTDRKVIPEILDSLPPEDAAVHASRRDLERINLAMGNRSWFGWALRRQAGRPLKILELGAGDGRQARLASRFLAEVQWIGLDRCPPPPDWPAHWRWIQGDVFEKEWPEADIIVANLFLHHFEEGDLARLGSKSRGRTRMWIISEPRRSLLHVAQLFLMRFWGMHPVTWNDGRISIIAGFRRQELPQALDPGGHFSWQVEETWRGAYRCIGIAK